MMLDDGCQMSDVLMCKGSCRAAKNLQLFFKWRLRQQDTIFV